MTEYNNLYGGNDIKFTWTFYTKMTNISRQPALRYDFKLYGLHNGYGSSRIIKINMMLKYIVSLDYVIYLFLKKVKIRFFHTL